MKKYLSLFSLAFGIASLSSADLVTSFTGFSNLNNSSLSVTSSVSVAAGDLVVMVATSNKRDSVVAVSFSSTAAGSFTDFSASSFLSSDPNPNSYLSYLSVGTGGTFDFVGTASGNITGNVGLYVLSPNSGGTVAILDSTALEYSGLATNASLSVTNNLSWAANANYSDIFVIEGTSSLRGNTANSGISLDIDAGDKRIFGSTTLAAGTLSHNSVWDITNAHASQTESGSAIAFAATELLSVPEPSSLSLLLLSGLLLYHYRRK